MSDRRLQKQILYNGQKYYVVVTVIPGGSNALYRYRVDLRNDEYRIIGQRTQSSNDLLNLVELVKWAVKDMPKETFLFSNVLAEQAKEFERWDGFISENIEEEGIEND